VGLTNVERGPRNVEEDAMKAKVGDRLVIDGTKLGERRRVGVVTKVSQPDGSPPFVVRWLDDDHETTVFPGPTARVESGEPATASS
jgi:hypothetical protein